ncbi:MAG: hypothetical protein AAFY60_16860, partial [Myxococcota bacterium]
QNGGGQDLTGAQDAYGRTIRSALGNGIETTLNYTAWGTVQNIEAHGPLGPVHDRRYSYDLDQNVIRRFDGIHQEEERFGYDGLGRITYAGDCAHISAPPTPYFAVEPQLHSGTNDAVDTTLQAMLPNVPKSALGQSLSLPTTDPDHPEHRSNGPTSLAPPTSIAIHQIGVPAGKNGEPILCGPSSSPSCQVLEYHENGNIKYRTGLGYYHYDASVTRESFSGQLVQETLPHAVSGFSSYPSGPSTGAMHYNERGHLMHRTCGDVNIDWLPGGKAAAIHSPSYQQRRLYDADDQLVYSVRNGEERWSAGDFERRLISTGGESVLMSGTRETSHYFVQVEGRRVAEIIHYESAPRVIASLSEQQEEGSGESSEAAQRLREFQVEHLEETALANIQGHRETRFFHNDLIGSPEVLTDSSGNVLEERRFDPFGRVQPVAQGL